MKERKERVCYNDRKMREGVKVYVDRRRFDRGGQTGEARIGGDGGARQQGVAGDSDTVGGKGSRRVVIRRGGAKE